MVRYIEVETLRLNRRRPRTNFSVICDATRPRPGTRVDMAHHESVEIGNKAVLHMIRGLMRPFLTREEMSSRGFSPHYPPRDSRRNAEASKR